MMTLPALFSAPTALYGCFIAAIIALWTPLKRPLVPLLGFAILLIGLATKIYTWSALLPLAALLFLAITVETTHRPWVRWLAIVGLLGGCFGLACHLFPGFYNVPVFDAVRLTPDAVPFTMSWTFDRPWIALLLLFPLSLHSARFTGEPGRAVVRIITAVFLLSALACASGYVRYCPKVPALWWVWAVNNLFIICVAEEAIFRGFLQRHLYRILPPLAAVGLSAVLFGLVHIWGGLSYALFSTIAGFFYGYQYHKTNRLEWAIATHFLLNLTHFFFFTYPSLRDATPLLG